MTIDELRSSAFGLDECLGCRESLDRYDAFYASVAFSIAAVDGNPDLEWSSGRLAFHTDTCSRNQQERPPIVQAVKLRPGLVKAPERGV